MAVELTEYSGAGDPKRSLELMWSLHEPPSRGPRARLTVPGVVRAAIHIADAEGLAALSMRKVAERLGVSPMSLYTYVPGKAELLDIMLDTVYGETARPEHVEGGWRARLELIARENWELFRRHPWMLQVSTGRPPLGPNLIAKYDYELRAVADVGLSEVEMDSVLTLTIGYVSGAARGMVEAMQAEQRTGMTDEQWWQAHAPLLGQVLDETRYPTAARVGAAAGAEHEAAFDPAHAFEFGLQRVLDGIDVLIRTRNSDGGAGMPG